jgi:hypothetical protein
VCLCPAVLSRRQVIRPLTLARRPRPRAYSPSRPKLGVVFTHAEARSGSQDLSYRPLNEDCRSSPSEVMPVFNIGVELGFNHEAWGFLTYFVSLISVELFPDLVRSRSKFVSAVTKSNQVTTKIGHV